MTAVRILDSAVDGLTHSFRVSLERSEVELAVDARLKDLAKTTRMPGFRPGRAPVKIMRQRFGSEVRAAVIDRMGMVLAREIIRDQHIEPRRRPIMRQDDSSRAQEASITCTLELEAAPDHAFHAEGGITLQRYAVPENAPELAEPARLNLRRQLLDALLAGHELQVPEPLVEAEYQRVRKGFEAEVGESVDSELVEELRRIAMRRVRLAILLTDIGRRKGITISHAEVDALVEREASRHPEHRDEIIDYYLDHPSALAELQAPLFEERVIEQLLEHSTIEEVVLDADTLRARLEFQ